jgi:hypothetical protein
MLSAKKINELVDKNKDLLEALEEFDRTGQLSKPSYKERATFTVDMGLMKKFRAYCEKNNQKMSNVIEELIKEMLGI